MVLFLLCVCVSDLFLFLQSECLRALVATARRDCTRPVTFANIPEHTDEANAACDFLSLNEYAGWYYDLGKPVAETVAAVEAKLSVHMHIGLHIYIYIYIQLPPPTSRPSSPQGLRAALRLSELLNRTLILPGFCSFTPASGLVPPAPLAYLDREGRPDPVRRNLGLGLKVLCSC